MKLILINDVVFFINGNNLTKGKIYDGDFTPTVYDPQTLQPSKPSYIIKCDDGKYRKFMTEHFLTLEEWRNQQIDKLL